MLVLNMLATLASERSKKTYGNRMVDVRATNAKLVARAFSMMQEVTGTADPVVSSAGSHRSFRSRRNVT
jgi:N-acetylmuramic acid 6-phosphate etherase